MIRLVLLLARGFRLASARVHAPWFWRALYRLLASPLAVRALAAVARRRGGDVLLARLGALFVWSGWPHQTRGWINLDASRYLRRVAREARRGRRVAAKAPPREPDGPLRVGVLGAFSGLLTLARAHFEDAPEEVELHVLDLGYEGRHARYLEPVVASYATDDLADAAGGLDVLYVVARGPEVDDVLDAARTSCVAAFCTGSDLLHHEKVDFHLYPQPEADYFLRGNSLFCGTASRSFGAELVYPAFFLYDRAGVQRTPLSEREHLVLFHGSLFKAASEPFLETVCGLLAADSELQLVLTGRASGADLERVRRVARGRGVESRVHYEGGFSGTRGPDGARDDPGWEKLLGYLRRARLAPDPWPIGGAAARVEAYAAGVPTAHLAVRFDEASWGRRQDSLLEVEALLVAEATARTVDEYRRLCERCLYDSDFAETVVAAQTEVCERVTDARAYWLQLVEAHRDWLRRVSRPRYAGAR